MTAYVVLLVALLGQELYALTRKKGNVPHIHPVWGIFAATGFFSLFAPFAGWAIAWPTWTTPVLFVVGTVGVLVSLTAVVQLGVNFTAGTATPQSLQTKGIYAFLENPDFLGLCLQLFALGWWFPGIWGLFAFYLRFTAAAVSQERTDPVRRSHRGADSGFWSLLISVFGDQRQAG